MYEVILKDSRDQELGRAVDMEEPEQAMLAVRTLWDDARSGLQGQRLVAYVLRDGLLVRTFDRRPDAAMRLRTSRW